jgi:hypothetical protein
VKRGSALDPMVGDGDVDGVRGTALGHVSRAGGKVGGGLAGVLGLVAIGAGGSSCRRDRSVTVGPVGAPDFWKQADCRSRSAAWLTSTRAAGSARSKDSCRRQGVRRAIERGGEVGAGSRDQGGLEVALEAEVELAGGVGGGVEDGAALRLAEVGWASPVGSGRSRNALRRAGEEKSDSRSGRSSGANFAAHVRMVARSEAGRHGVAVGWCTRRAGTKSGPAGRRWNVNVTWLPGTRWRRSIDFSTTWMGRPAGSSWWRRRPAAAVDGVVAVGRAGGTKVAGRGRGRG